MKMEKTLASDTEILLKYNIPGSTFIFLLTVVAIHGHLAVLNIFLVLEIGRSPSHQHHYFFFFFFKQNLYKFSLKTNCPSCEHIFYTVY